MPAIRAIITDNKLAYSDLEGIIAWQGPGSFTGLRIGLASANALAYGLGRPIVGTTGDGWITSGVLALKAGEYNAEKLAAVFPEYGAEANITKPKK